MCLVSGGYWADCHVDNKPARAFQVNDITDIDIKPCQLHGESTLQDTYEVHEADPLECPKRIILLAYVRHALD